MDNPIEPNLGQRPVEERLHSAEYLREPETGIVKLVDVLQSNTGRLKQILNAARCVSANQASLAAGALRILGEHPAIAQDVLDGFSELLVVLSEVQTTILQGQK